MPTTVHINKNVQRAILVGTTGVDLRYVSSAPFRQDALPAMAVMRIADGSFLGDSAAVTRWVMQASLHIAPLHADDKATMEHALATAAFDISKFAVRHARRPAFCELADVTDAFQLMQVIITTLYGRDHQLQPTFAMMTENNVLRRYYVAFSEACANNSAHAAASTVAAFNDAMRAWHTRLSDNCKSVLAAHSAGTIGGPVTALGLTVQVPPFTDFMPLMPRGPMASVSPLPLPQHPQSKPARPQAQPKHAAAPGADDSRAIEVTTRAALPSAIKAALAKTYASAKEAIADVPDLAFLRLNGKVVCVRHLLRGDGADACDGHCRRAHLM